MTGATQAPLVRVAVLNWNGGDMTLRCFDHLAASTYPADRLQLVLVDNDSHDGSVELVTEAHPQVEVIRNGANLGFVGLNSALVDRKGADYVALVNNDAFCEPGWLEPLVEVLEADPGLGAAAAKMVFAPAFHEVVLHCDTFRPPGDGRDLGVQLHELRVDGEVVDDLAQFPAGWYGIEARPGGTMRWSSGDAVVRVPVPADETAADLRFAELMVAAEADKQVELRSGRYRLRASVGPEPRRVKVPLAGPAFDVVQNAGSVLIEDGFGADRGFMAVDHGQFDESAEVFNVCGGAVLLRAAFLADVGVLDDRFFLYYEDTDLSWRGQQLGWRYRYVPTSVLRHLHGASGGEGSDVFHFHVERNRLLMLAKNAPWRLALTQAIGFVTATASYVRRDVLPPLRHRRRPPLRHVRNRVRSFLSFLRLLPAMLVDRRALRRRRTVGDADLARRWMTREAWSAHERSVAVDAGTVDDVVFPPWSDMAGS